MHVGMVELEGTKMSKSLGNLIFVSDLLKEWDAAAIRVAIIGHHYRSNWEWFDHLMPAAADRLERWRAAGPGDGALDEVRAALDDDLDTPRAMAAIDEAAASGQGVSEAAGLLGVF
jgi:L-cysteine:1D-myo-inositol 2-amino-2-deoxy-alpha-D-glucopyranoside ligase